MIEIIKSTNQTELMVQIFEQKTNELIKNKKQNI